MLAYGAAQPAQAPVFEDLTAWLTAHHLSYGLSGYTQANIVTVEGQGNITLRPAGPAGPGGRTTTMSTRSWCGTVTCWSGCAPDFAGQPANPNLAAPRMKCRLRPEMSLGVLNSLLVTEDAYV
jgi:hypothetical protein